MENFKPDPMFDRHKGRICHKHFHITDDYGDCPHCLRGVEDEHDISFIPLRRKELREYEKI